jgi:hypothetical protein
MFLRVRDTWADTAEEKVSIPLKVISILTVFQNRSRLSEALSQASFRHWPKIDQG